MKATLKAIIDICHASEIDTYCIDVETKNGTLFLERVSEITWGIDTDDGTKFVKNDEVLSWFDDKKILKICVSRYYDGDTDEDIVAYSN